MSDKSLMALPEHIDELFTEMDSRIVIALQESDAAYSALVRERSNMARSFPKIEQWLEGSGALTLTEEENAVAYKQTMAETHKAASVNAAMRKKRRANRPGEENRASGLFSFMGLTAKTVKPALIWANLGDFCSSAWYNH